jgi:2-polyprenyl-6-methoxyphenol hydroxylase-like FAD-dependent oxidoreductase
MMGSVRMSATVPAASIDCDVAIAGAGPVGLCLAMLLAQAGLSVRVFELEEAVSEDLRASTFHSPTMDLLEPSGVTAELLERGLVCPSWQIRLHPTGERAVFDLSVLAGDTKHPYRLQCEQWKLSQALLKRVQGLANVEVCFSSEVMSVADRGGHAEVTVRRNGREEIVRAAIAVGADGARSIVRKAMNLSFDGETYPETTVLVTTLFPFEEHLEGLSNVTYCWKEGGNFSLLKVPGRWRASIYPREDMPIEDQLTEEAIEASLQIIVPRRERYEVLDKRPYRVHQRIVAKYNAGRLALAGDAAHLNSPSGGMGLNGGIHDAFELAAAIKDMLKGNAGLERLDLYDRRRRPIARDQIIAQADRNRARMREKDHDRRMEMLRELQAITSDRDRLYAYLLKSSMIEGFRQSQAIS